MMPVMRLAIEYERGFHTLEGLVANEALSVLGHPLNLDAGGKTIYFHAEGTQHQLEWRSRPHASVRNLAREFLHSENILAEIIGDKTLALIPVSETGAGRALPNPETGGRAEGYRVIFGAEMLRQLLTISGLHIHLDINREQPAEQYNALLALRPAIAFTSTSPLMVNRKNGVNCHRYKLIADPEEGLFRSIPEPRGYVGSLREIELQSRQRYQLWNEAFRRKGPTEGCPPSLFEENFSWQRTGYPDIRYRPDMGVGTYEVRMNDTAPADIVIGYAALLSGYLNRISRENIPVLISTHPSAYWFNPGEILLPHPELLEELSSAAISYGLEDSSVREYLTAVADFAREGLPRKERSCLVPLYRMLETGKNWASRMLQAISSEPGPVYSPEAAAKANRVMWAAQLQGIQTLKGES